MERKFDLDRTVRLCITIVVVIVLFLLTRQLSGVLLPFVVSWFIAYLIHPIVSFFQYKCRLKNRTLSVAATLVLLLVLLVGIVAALVGPVSAELSRMLTLITSYVSGLSVDTVLPAAWQEDFRDWLAQYDWQSLLTFGNIENVLNKITPYISGLLGGSISLLGSLLVVFVSVLYVIFILIDYENITAGMVEMIPPKFKKTVTDVLADLETGMNKYFRGQALIAMTVGILFSIGFLIMGLPLAIVVGLFIGLLNMVPYLQAAGIPLCMLLGVLQSADTGTAYWIILIEIAAVFIVVQTIQDMLLTPLIMGKTIGMKPAVMLLALSIWGSLLGVAGMIIALPLTTVMLSYYKRYVLQVTEDVKPVLEETPTTEVPSEEIAENQQ
ncbi:MAG: AI-2E family transporter [Paludibacteraceae bacterium]|nr:AI-2E family transporter [Paludibacteraceae bacterium]